ncbi:MULTISPECIES: fibronectin type III domain-containing protein [Sphingobium]|uniref:fibronectin type III domain-containing protein n=1 Tax=Sphingobium TaxID=165695 RepID=UPI0015EC911B|nr:MULTISPECIES: fibronectin type III domain-containing protein [Sphingobium]MCW2361607.1 hypothetical protein [Sphingobium sp. B10D3B]MCW2401714.1 hypothetical protein [Sphingobium sp. B10D7B]MCW2408693.1 hypothetical protein [Sphingobium xanthum]
MIMRPLPVAVLSGTNSLPGYQPSNIANDWLGMVWKGQAAGAASQSFIVDLREDLPADTIALLGLSGAASNWLLQVSAATNAQGAFTGASHAWPAVPLLAGSVMFPSGRGRAYWEKPATGPSAARYWRVTITTPANNTPVTVARVVIGQRLQPERNFSFGAAFGIRDHGKAEWSTRAVLLRRRGLKLRSTGLSFASLYRDEIENLIDPILAAVGATDPILLVTDPDPHAQRQNRIYFGPLIGDIGTIWARANAGFQWQANVVDLEPIGDVGASFTPPTPTPAPSWTSPPTVSGAGSPPRVGDVLTATGGTILNGDHAGWRWLRDGALISGATGVTYVLTIDDLGALVGPRQLASGPGGSGSNDGNPVGPVNPTVPAVISGLAAAAGNGQAVLSFDAPSDGGSPITDYVYQYKLAASSTWTTFADGTSGVTGATITGLANGQAYNFRGAAVNSVGQQTTWSNVANATPVAPVASYTAGFILSQFPAYDDKRIYQRTTTAGGGQGKGAGTIRVPLSGTVTAGTIGARIRSAADGTTILQAEWTAGTIANGASYIDVSGIDARLGWFFVDLKGADGSWQLGSVQVGMGRLVGGAGQSLMARMLGRQDGQSATYASLGVTIDPNTAVLASYSEGNSYMPAPATAPWQVPGDFANGAGPNSVGCGEFLRRQVALFGVNCGMIGHSQGGTSLNSFLSGGGNYTQFSGMLARAGGAFEAFIWGQGHSDANSGVPATGYATGLDMLFSGISALNSRAGYAKYIWTIPTIKNSTWGTPYERNRVRKGAVDWCSANSATYVHMEDFQQVDGVHQSQAGAVTMARAMHRATRPEVGASGANGPAILLASRSGTTITVTLSDVGQSTLVLTGTPGNRIRAFVAGYCDNDANPGANAYPISAVSVVNKTTLSITLANDPGVGQLLDLYMYWPNDPNDATADNIRDDRTDGDGITVGRTVVPNQVPVLIAAPTPGGATNAPPGGYVAIASPFDLVPTGATYGAGAASFGNEMTGGTALSGNGKTPYFSPITVEGFFTCPSLPGSTEVLVGGLGSNFIALSSSGKIVTGAGGPGATTLVPGRRYHIAWQAGPNGLAIYLTDITSGTAGVRDYISAPAVQIQPQGGRFGLRTHMGSFNLTGGAVDEWAVWEIERYSGSSYTCPTAPLSPTSPGLVALYRCDGNANDAVGR